MKHYQYNGRPVLYLGLLFLVLFPLFAGGLVWLLGFFKTAFFYGLLALYLADVLAIGGLLANSWEKKLGISEQTLAFENKLFYRECEPDEIQDIMLYATHKGKEFLRIRTKRKTYFFDEQYQPWGSLLVEIEKFAKANNVISNLVD